MMAAAETPGRPDSERHTDGFGRRRQQRRGVGRSIRLRIAVAAVLWVATEAQLMPVRWWHSSNIAAALSLTGFQSAEMDRIYQQLVPASESASIDVIRLTERAVLAIRYGEYDDNLLHVTADLVRARDQQCALRRTAFARSSSTLSPVQRATLASLLAQHALID
jgi:hypothetical protein